MGISRGQHTPLTVGFCLLLSLFGRQRCTAFPAVAELPADPWAHGAGANLEVPKTDEYGNGEGIFGEDIFTGDTNADDQDWGSYADLQGDGGSLGHYDANDWGSFFIPASSSDEAEYDHGDYDPLGGGMFTSDIIDPSISHSLYGGSTPNQEDISQTGGHNSNTNVKLLPTNGFGFDTSQNSFDTNGIEQGGVGLPEEKPGMTPGEVGGESNHETNAIDETIHPEARPIQDAPLSNVLSSVLANGDDIPSVPQEADMSVDFNGIGVQARHGAADRLTDKKDEKPAGRSLGEALDTIQHTSRTEGNSVHSLLSQIVVLVNRLIEAQGKQAAS